MINHYNFLKFKNLLQTYFHFKNFSIINNHPIQILFIFSFKFGIPWKLIYFNL
jgi:hypothetical protein